MLHLAPETFWQVLPSGISNLYSFNTVLHQRISQHRRTLDKSAALIPHPSNSASFLRWIIRLFKVVSSNLLRDSTKFLHYYILYHKSSRLSSHSIIEQARRAWPSPLYPCKKHCTHCTGNQWAPEAVWSRAKNLLRPHQNAIPRLLSP